MLTKSMIAIAAAAFALTAALPVERAEAGSNFDINVGLGFGGYVGPGYGSVDVEFEGEYVSCAQARKMVRWNGFSDVKSLDCSAPNYKFSVSAVSAPPSDWAWNRRLCRSL